MKLKTPVLSATLFASLLALTAGGCATKKFVRSEVSKGTEPTEQRVGELEGKLEENQQAIANTNRRVDSQGNEIATTSRTAKDALDRAVAAGKLAEGRLLSETVFSDDKVRFSMEKTQLNDEGKAALDEFALPLKSQDKSIYIEIQGHTDTSGSENYNMRLGEQRAEAVRRYLNLQHGIPLHRMNVISYGETAPAYDNSTLEGRRANRRVVLVVLK